MTIARRGLKVKVKLMGQANVVGLTLTEGSFLWFLYKLILIKIGYRVCSTTLK